MKKTKIITRPGQTEASRLRDLDVWDLRQAGHTYRSIGKKHGISQERARQLWNREETLRAEYRPPEFRGPADPTIF